MSELPEGELAGVGVDAPQQADSPPGGLSSHPEAPVHPHLGQAAAAPTSGLLRVPNEDPLLFNEFEIDGGEATQPPASSESLAASTVTTDVVAGTSLQQRSANY